MADAHNFPDEPASDDEDLQDVDSHNIPATQPPASENPPPMRTSARGKPTANTGPKGVKADYEEAKARMRAKRIDEAIRRERMLNRMAVGDAVFVQEKEVAEHLTGGTKNPEADSDEDLEDDDAVFMEYKMQQIAKIKQSLAKYGSLQEIEASQFLDAVDNVPKSTYVVIHLYKDTLEACVRLNYSLEVIAKQFPFVKFLKIVVSKIKPTFSDNGLPAMVVFKGGEQLHSFVCLVKEFGSDKFTDKNVFDFLSKHGILRERSNLDQTLDRVIDTASSDQSTIKSLKFSRLAIGDGNDSDSSFGE